MLKKKSKTTANLQSTKTSTSITTKSKKNSSQHVQNINFFEPDQNLSFSVKNSKSEKIKKSTSSKLNIFTFNEKENLKNLQKLPDYDDADLALSLRILYSSQFHLNSSKYNSIGFPHPKYNRSSSSQNMFNFNNSYINTCNIQQNNNNTSSDNLHHQNMNIRYNDSTHTNPNNDPRRQVHLGGSGPHKHQPQHSHQYPQHALHHPQTTQNKHLSISSTSSDQNSYNFLKSLPNQPNQINLSNIQHVASHNTSSQNHLPNYTSSGNHHIGNFNASQSHQTPIEDLYNNRPNSVASSINYDYGFNIPQSPLHFNQSNPPSFGGQTPRSNNMPGLNREFSNLSIHSISNHPNPNINLNSSMNMPRPRSISTSINNMAPNSANTNNTNNNSHNPHNPQFNPHNPTPSQSQINFIRNSSDVMSLSGLSGISGNLGPPNIKLDSNIPLGQPYLTNAAIQNYINNGNASMYNSQHINSMVNPSFNSASSIGERAFFKNLWSRKTKDRYKISQKHSSIKEP